MKEVILKEEFLANISHELRTPLAVIIGWAELLRDGEVAADEMDLAFEAILRNALNQLQMINDMLNYSLISTGHLRLSISQVELPSVIENAVRSFSLAADNKEIRIVRVIDSLATTVIGDAARLQQVIWHLLSNAIKFTPRCGRIEIVLARIDDHIEIQVKDSGIGISAECLPQIFETFHQADSSSTRQYSGIGLGLALVHRLVELHGGTVMAESAGKGQGATFTVKLPLLVM